MTGQILQSKLSALVDLRVVNPELADSGYSQCVQAVDKCTKDEHAIVRLFNQSKCINIDTVYSKAKNTQVYLLIVIIVLIILRILQCIQIIHTTGEGMVVTVMPLVWHSNTSCWLSYNQFRFKLRHCDGIEEGTVVEITGRVAVQTDDAIFTQKTLIDTSYTSHVPAVTSLLYWQSQLAVWTARARSWFVTPIRQTVSYPEEVLAESFVLGSGVELPEAIEHSVKVMGIAHIIAVSGSHLTLLIGMLVVVVKTKKSTINTTIIIGILLLYATLVGWQPAVTRALLMSVIVLLGKTVLHRQVSVGRSLLASSAIMVISNPWVVLNIGRQLSIFATAGICWLYPKLLEVLAFRRRLKRIEIEDKRQDRMFRIRSAAHRVWRLSLEATIASVAALACIWPIIISNFGIWSWGTILSSLFLWWLFPLVIGSCFIGVITIRLLTLVYIHPAIVQICSSLLLEWPVRSVTWLFENLNYLEWMMVTVPEVSDLVYLGWYAFLGAMVLVFTWFDRFYQRRRYAVLQPIKYFTSSLV